MIDGMKVFILFGRERLLFWTNLLLLAGVCLVCALFIWLATSEDTFDGYGTALPIVFAQACAAILIGLMLSINMVSKDYAMIRRELRMGISVGTLVMAKTLLIILACAIMSLILVLPYLVGIISVPGHSSIYLFAAIFFPMFASAQLGLFISSLSSFFRSNRLKKIAFAIPFVMLFQILFSGFVFDGVRIETLQRISISNYAIRMIGAALRFNVEYYRGTTFIWELPDGQEFGRELFGTDTGIDMEHITETFGVLMIFVVLAVVASIVVLSRVDKQGFDE